MTDKTEKEEKQKGFDEIWKNTRHEIFRLELLNTYLVDYEKEPFERYKRREKFNALEYPDFIEWLSNIEQKVKESVRIIDIQVLDLPMSEYLKFGISTGSIFAAEKGEEFLFIERDKVKDLIFGFQDYWMFDSKIIISMDYDSEGRFIKKEYPIVRDKNLSKYIDLKNELLKVAIPMNKFLRINNISLSYKSRRFSYS